MELVLATLNRHKTREFRQLLGAGFVIKDLNSIAGAILPAETGTTFEQNAILKAVYSSKSTDDLVIADDSGLEVDALGAAPGIYSARYAGEKASDAANMDKLLRELGSVTNRSARFRCLIALARAGKVLGAFEGVVEGKIADHPRGVGGFGYDPVFQPTGSEETFAEMAPAAKNKISHRGKAIAELRKKLREMAD